MHRSKQNLSVRQSVSWWVNAEERKKPPGKSDCESLDSSDSWDKVATSAEKTENDAGRE